MAEWAEGQHAPASARAEAAKGTVSLLHNNLTCSPGYALAALHNSVNVSAGRVLLSPVGGSFRDGPEANQATSIRFLQLAHATILCVCSTNGTQFYTEDGSGLLYFGPVGQAAAEPDKLTFHQGACVVPDLQHVVIGRSSGGLVLVGATPDRYTPLSESAPAGQPSEVADLCYSAAAASVISAHGDGALRMWSLTADGPYSNTAVVPASGEAPIRCASLGIRLLVAYGPGYIKLYDCRTLEAQVEITAHARWITAVDVREEYGQVATVGEDTCLNVWNVAHDNGEVSVAHSSFITDKLLTGVAFIGNGAAVTAYDSGDIFYAEF